MGRDERWWPGPGTTPQVGGCWAGRVAGEGDGAHKDPLATRRVRAKLLVQADARTDLNALRTAGPASSRTTPTSASGQRAPMVRASRWRVWSLDSSLGRPRPSGSPRPVARRGPPRRARGAGCRRCSHRCMAGLGRRVVATSVHAPVLPVMRRNRLVARMGARRHSSPRSCGDARILCRTRGTARGAIRKAVAPASSLGKEYRHARHRT